MVREIEKPNIEFKLNICSNYKFYYDEENREYFFETKWKSKYYFNLKGILHRIGKPAIEYYDGRIRWMENGKMHRLDGPASINYFNKEYAINDKHYSKKEFAKETKHLVCRNCGRFCKQRCFI